MNDDFNLEDFGLDNVSEVMKSNPSSHTEEVKPKTTTSSNWKSKNKTESLWNKTDIQGKEIDTSKFLPSKKEFCIVDNWNIKDDKLELLKKVATYLFNLGYTYRSIGYNKDKIDMAIRSLPNARFKVYKCWPKAKIDSEDAEIGCEGLDPEAYAVCVSYYKNFLTKKEIRRSQLARYTNLLLGPKCIEPVDFILAYTDCGSTSLNKNFNLETGRDAWYGFKLAKVANLSIFNINNKNFTTDFKSYIAAISGSQPKIQEQPATQVVTSNTQQPKSDSYEDLLP